MTAARHAFGGEFAVEQILFLLTEDGLDGLHDRDLRLHPAESLNLVDRRLQLLRIDERVVALSVIVAAEPQRDVVRIGDLVKHELVARDLRDVDRDLRPRNGAWTERKYEGGDNKSRDGHDRSTPFQGRRRIFRQKR